MRSDDGALEADGLRARFERFIRTLPGCEDIDDLLRFRDPHGMRRADYLLHGRSVIVEQKALEVDPRDKGQRLVSGWIEDRGILAYGRLPAHVVLSEQPDAAALNRKLALKLSQVIESAVSEADKQTRDTKEVLELPQAGGLLILLNEAAPSLDPNLVVHRLGHLLSARGENGELRYRHNQAALLLQEGHVCADHPGHVFPCVLVRSPDWREHLEVEGVASTLLRQWAAFNGRPYLEGGDVSMLERLRRRDERVR